MQSREQRVNLLWLENVVYLSTKVGQNRQQTADAVKYSGTKDNAAQLFLNGCSARK